LGLVAGHVLAPGNSVHRSRFRIFHSWVQHHCAAGLPPGRRQSNQQRRIYRPDLAG
jgi:hypothetical protein